MTEASTAQIVAVLRQRRGMHPDWRVGQLVANVAMFARGPIASAVWDVEDTEFVHAAEEHPETHSPAAVAP